jgi:hypothetical protein
MNLSKYLELSSRLDTHLHTSNKESIDPAIWFDLKKIQLKPGSSPPKGVEIHEGPHGGYFWETSEIPDNVKPLPGVRRGVQGIKKRILTPQEEEWAEQMAQRGRDYTEKLESKSCDDKDKTKLPKMHPVESSNVKAVGYCPKQLRLYISFLNGRTYTYDDFLKSEYNKFLYDPTPDPRQNYKPSYGHHVWKEIRDQYAYDQVK